MSAQRAGKDKKKIILGLTGSFGSGKSTVARIFKSQGAKIIDADRIAHKIIQPSGKVYQRIVDAFGNNILKKNKTVDRDKLAKIVFNNKDSLKKLNAIIHPQVIRIIKGRIKTSSAKVIVLDAPLLLEADLKNLVDKIIVVKINKKKQMDRLLNKLALKKSDILKRIKAQIPLVEKIRLADFVIDNSGTVKNTEEQVKSFWMQFIASEEQVRRLKWKNWI